MGQRSCHAMGSISGDALDLGLGSKPEDTEISEGWSPGAGSLLVRTQHLGVPRGGPVSPATPDITLGAPETPRGLAPVTVPGLPQPCTTSLLGASRHTPGWAVGPLCLPGQLGLGISRAGPSLGLPGLRRVGDRDPCFGSSTSSRQG